MEANAEVRDPDLNKLFEDYKPLVWAVCRKTIQNMDMAREAFQESWLSIIKSIPDYRGQSRISTWIYSITYRTAIHIIRKERTYTTRFLKGFFHGDDREFPDQTDLDKTVWVKSECERCLTGVLHCLEPESRLAYVFRDVASLSYKDIAFIFQAEEAAVRKMISRSREKLRRFLSAECGLYRLEQPVTARCRCRMGKLVDITNLPQEFEKLRSLKHKISFFQASEKILPGKLYWLEQSGWNK